MRPDYAAAYENLYLHHWWWRARRALILKELRRLAPPGGFGKILDIGCGNGLFFDDLRELGTPEGVEPDAALVDPRGSERGLIHRVPFDSRFRPGSRYGLILMLDVLEHLPDDVEALGHAASLLTPQGVLFVTVPAFKALWTSHDLDNHHYTRYTRKSFRQVAQGAGLRPTRMWYFFHWLFPCKLLVRWKEAVVGPGSGTRRPPREPFNTMIFRLCRTEQFLSRRLPFPFGSSLLVQIEGPERKSPRRRGRAGARGSGGSAA